MSWKGVKKSISRLPHNLKNRNGGEDVTRDLEYHSLESRYKELVKFSDNLCVETVAYRDSLSSMLHHQLECANNLAEVYGLVEAGTSDLPPKLRQGLEDYATSMAYCREETLSLIDDLQKSVIKPANDYQMLTRSIDKTITKRQHKLIDFDRHRISYLKYSAITDPSPSEEKNMIKMKNQFETAQYDYNHFNDMLKDDLIKFLNLTQYFIEPVVKSFYDVQCRAYGGFYGRLDEVIQHNQSLFPTLNMSIQDGYTQRTLENNTILDLEDIDILKGSRKSSSLKSNSTAYSMNSYQQDDVSNQLNPSLSSLSLNSGRRIQSSYSNSSINNIISPPPQMNDNRPSNGPPALKKKPSLSFTTLSNNVASRSSSIQNNASLASIKQDASTTFSNAKRASNIIDNHKQGKLPTLSDVKFGYQMSKQIPSSAYAPKPLVVNEIKESPFLDQKETIKKKRAPPPPPPSRGASKKEYVEALYDLEASQAGDLSFSVGDRIEIIERSDKLDDWWKGRIGNQVGMFPANYVRQGV